MITRGTLAPGDARWFFAACIIAALLVILTQYDF